MHKIFHMKSVPKWHYLVYQIWCRHLESGVYKLQTIVLNKTGKAFENYSRAQNIYVKSVLGRSCETQDM